MKWGESQELRGSLKPGDEGVFLKRGKINPGSCKDKMKHWISQQKSPPVTSTKERF